MARWLYASAKFGAWRISSSSSARALMASGSARPRAAARSAPPCRRETTVPTAHRRRTAARAGRRRAGRRRPPGSPRSCPSGPAPAPRPGGILTSSRGEQCAEACPRCTVRGRRRGTRASRPAPRRPTGPRRRRGGPRSRSNISTNSAATATSGARGRQTSTRCAVCGGCNGAMNDSERVVRRTKVVAAREMRRGPGSDRGPDLPRSGKKWTIRSPATNA